MLVHRARGVGTFSSPVAAVGAAEGHKWMCGGSATGLNELGANEGGQEASMRASGECMGV